MPAHKKSNSKKSRKDLAVDFDYPVNGDSLVASPDSPGSPPSLGNGELTSPRNNGRSVFPFSLDEKIVNLTALNGTLIREISSLRLDKENLTCKINELEKQLQEDAFSRDSMFHEHRNFKTNSEDLSAKISALEHDAKFLTDEKAALSRERATLLQDKEMLEGALSEAMHNLADSLKQAETSESSAAIAKARIHALETEVEKVLSWNQALNEERVDLKALVDERDKELQELKLRMLAMEDERQSFVCEVEKAVESANGAKKTMGALRSEITRLEEQNITRERKFEDGNLTLKTRLNEEYMNLERKLKQENADLEKALSASKLDSLKMESEKLHVIEMLKQLEAETASLHKELNLAKSEQSNTVLELEKEQDAKIDLLKEISTAASSKKMLEESLNSALASLDKFQENAEQMGRQIVMLEDHTTCLSKQITELQISKQDLELDLQNQITDLTNGVNFKQAENSVLKQKLSSIKMVLWDMETKSKSGKKKLWELVSELKSVQNLLHKKEHVVKYAVPIAAVSSGTLAFISLLAYLKFRKKH